MNDKASIDDVTARFYALFTTRNGSRAMLEDIHELFIPQGVIVKTCGEVPVVYDLQGFTEPRERLLQDGELLNFEERELAERTSIMGYVAQRFSLYGKSGTLRGKPFEARGVKTMQFVRASGEWKLSALAWDDERDGFTINDGEF